ncbi:MAG TPA: chain length determinant protein tyrosine kinase EpsG [Thiobacillaceae bacterium]|nr:chain length determinant protein tyrosine kinase EpsG [Thiobacillaceae bacterium]HNU62893.1 chain length determinant protein tyrosine kinase EpsG [Thiobacillaceae bacterium]
MTPVSSEQSAVTPAGSPRGDDHIGTLLQAAGKLKPQDMERVLRLQKEQDLRFGEAAQRLGLVNADDIRTALSRQFEYPTLPAANTKLGAELIAAFDPYSREAEALRSLRSELLLRWFRDGRKTLAIGSVGSHEGASYLAANLAVLFAQMGRNVLLIDANLRQPRQQAIFGLGNGLGLSDLLAERVATLQVEAVQPFSTLAVLTAGSPPPNPAELLARPTLGSLLARLEPGHDIILLDTAPAELAADYQVVAARAGGMLISTRRNVSRLAPLAEMKDKISFTGAQVVGAVVLD